MFRTIISAQDLKRYSQEGEWIICDCRFDIHFPAQGYQAFKQGHLPSAVYVDLEQRLSSKPDGTNGRHPLPSVEALVDSLESLGISNHTQVVAYDDDGGGYAARLWWILKYLGHEAAAILDGGIQAWVAAGFELSRDMVQPKPGNFNPDPQASRMLSADELSSLLGGSTFLLLDSRAPERYRGEEEPIDPVAGHIPGAENRYWRENLDPHGYFKPGEEIRTELEGQLQDRPADNAVVYCGSGVTACHNLLAFTLAGFTMPRLYPGSWSEWSADPGRPVAAGPE